MNNLIQFSRAEYEEFFKWLLGSENIEISKEIDISKCLEYDEPYIYYTEEIKNLFQTGAMNRLGKIGQLVNATYATPNASHTRLSHCKGAYQKMLDFYMTQYKNSEWKEKNSSEDSRLKVLADMIDMATHDIGHNTCSHALESLIGSGKGAHEVLGARILHENIEVVEALKNIHPKLPETLDVVKKEDYNLHSLKEGSIDFDRADFLVRDSIYLSVQNGFEKLGENKSSISEVITGITNGCEIVPINYGGKEIEIPVFTAEAVPFVEEFLERRAENYRYIYNSLDNKPIDLLLESFCRILVTIDDTESDLGQFVKHLASSDVKDIDIDEFLSWDDIRFYNSVFHIIDNTKNEHLKRMTISCMPDLESLESIVYERLMPGVTPKIDENGNEIDLENEFESDEDRCFYLRVKGFAKNPGSYDEYTQNGRYRNGVFKKYFETRKDRVEFMGSLRQELENDGYDKTALLEEVQAFEWLDIKIKKYDKREPIFIKGKDGKIYTFDEYPERKMSLDPIEYHGIIAFDERLLLCGLSNENIEKCRNLFGEEQNQNILSKDMRQLNELHDRAMRLEEQDDGR